MKKIEFFGAAGNEVTGSCYHIVGDDGKELLVDFGMFQGTPDIVTRNYEMLGFDPGALQAVFLTHAHLDHSGRLPLLVSGGFRGNVYMTAPTKALIDIILNDSARIAEKDLEREPLYAADDVAKLLRMVQTVEYDTPVAIGNYIVNFRDAGHILGSASIVITENREEKTQTIVFSGDLGNTPQGIVKPTTYIEEADVVVMETTYGDTLHPEEDPKQVIQEEINAIEKDNGVLLIPAFALERTQELLHIIHHLKKEGKVRLDTAVYLDGPMGIDATHVYLNYEEYTNDEIQGHKDTPYEFEGLMITDEGRESRKIIKQQNPKVIIAGSGMVSGGRIMQHAANYLPDATTRMLFVGYQAEETTGREILEGAKSVWIQNTQVKVRAHIREIKTLSSHADQKQLLTWLSHIKGVKKVFLTHGEEHQRKQFEETIKKELGIQNVVLPEYEQSYELS